MSLYSENTSNISQSYHYRTNYQIDYSTDADTTVFLKVFIDSQDPILLKEYSLAIYDCPDDTFESNNTVSDARILFAPGEYTLENYDTDYFMLQPGDSVVDACVKFDPDSVALVMTLLDSKNKTLNEVGLQSTGALRIRYSSDTLDTIYYCIRSSSKGSKSDIHRRYTLAFTTYGDDSLEQNDEMGREWHYPTVLTKIDSTYSIDNLLYRDEDNFSVESKSKEVLFRVVFEDTTVPLHILIYEKDLTSCHSADVRSTSTGSNYHLTSVTSYSSGTILYYVKVASYSLCALNSYRLEMIPLE